MKVSFIFGTRPEAVKLAPVILAMEDDPDLHPHVCVTGQHQSMLDQILRTFDIEPHENLQLMQQNQSLASFTSRALAAVDGYLSVEQPDLVLVQGDTSTVLCAALAAFYRQIPVGHIEAGLRTGNRYSPFPEEMNRVLASQIADYHFAPTANARTNLLNAGVDPHKITVTGNTIVDALQLADKLIQD
ncbi:MAG: UDP-N-acetylglucosamine 2-epimerase (non-hydrolyzing), partial [Planctomycetes bacterium]|nr:UDP-N-acetylglucosamine 2-epimerase (non-hydrolyzing) [Planctomycetota bacterium]